MLDIAFAKASLAEVKVRSCFWLARGDAIWRLAAGG